MERNLGLHFHILYQSNKADYVIRQRTTHEDSHAEPSFLYDVNRLVTRLLR